MNWFVMAESNISSLDISRKLKKIIRDSPFFINLFKKYNVPIDVMDDNLTFKIRKMRGVHAQSNSKEISLNSKLFENGDFFENHIHFVIHELVHWLTRQRENKYYFSDHEEIEAFIYGMAYQLFNGKNKIEIEKTFYPIIKEHFKSEIKAKIFFEYLFEEAIRKIDYFQNGE